MNVNSGVFAGNLPAAANVALTDDLLVVSGAGTSNASLRQVPFATLCTNVALAQSTPANSTAAGFTGQIAFDASFIYVAVSNNQWGRAALATTGW